MNETTLPKTYEEWHQYITVQGGVKLTPDYISDRIAALKDDKDNYTKQFIELYGQQYREQVLGWFLQAQKKAAA